VEFRLKVTSLEADFSVRSLSGRFVVSFKWSSNCGNLGMPAEEAISFVAN